MNEIKVGDWTLTPTAVENLRQLRGIAQVSKAIEACRCVEACQILGIDPTTDSTARDICEEIVLHGTPVDKVIAKLQRHLEGGR
jgi:hypothetical protein